MLIIDRSILIRFLSNFAVLFVLLFVFAVAVDLILNLDRFVDAAKVIAGPGGGPLGAGIQLIQVVVNFHAPRLFQFYAYLHGLVAIGAMAFTLAQMHRYRELVAVLASGVSLYRLAVPFFAAVFGLSMIQLLNQELILPRVAPMLLRDHGEIGRRGLDSFPVRFTPDGNGHLLQAPEFHPQEKTLVSPTILERDEAGRTVRRITAEKAVWSDERSAWVLRAGTGIRPAPRQESHSEHVLLSEPVEEFSTDLNPEALLVRRNRQFASMLSLPQITRILDSPTITDREMLLRYRYSRFSSVLVNLLVLALTLPCFLLREPARLLRQSVICAALAIPASMGAAIGMMVKLPGITPALGVFLPVVILLFVSLFPWTYFKT